VHDESATTLFNNSVWAGILDRDFWPALPNDQVAFGFTYYDSQQEADGHPANPGTAR
jgi:hypothetical protein